MRMSFLKIIAVASLGLVLGSPAFADEGQIVSTLMGVGVGGALGSMVGHGDGRVAATGAGMVLGGVIGSELGRPSYGPTYATSPAYYSYSYPNDMFPAYRDYAPYQPNYVAPPALPPPPPVTYLDDEKGSYCREFSQQVRLGNEVREIYGTACLQPDGSWHIVQ